MKISVSYYRILIFTIEKIKIRLNCRNGIRDEFIGRNGILDEFIRINGIHDEFIGHVWKMNWPK